MGGVAGSGLRHHQYGFRRYMPTSTSGSRFRYLLAPLLVADASAGIVPVDGGMYMAMESGRILGRAIVGVYLQADNFCAKQGKEVSTVKLD